MKSKETKLNEYVILYQDLGLAYFVDKKTKQITFVTEIEKLDLDKVREDNIPIRYGR